MTRPRAKKRLPRWPDDYLYSDAGNKTLAVRGGGVEDTVWFREGSRDSNDVKRTIKWLTRWLAAYDARQKRGKP